VYNVKTEKSEQYFEAIIQLRHPSQEGINCVVNAIKKKPGVFIAQEIKQKDGVDIYMSSQRFARSIGKLLKKSFKGTLKESKRLFGMNRQKSRQIYRGTILFRFEDKEDKKQN